MFTFRYSYWTTTVFRAQLPSAAIHNLRKTSPVLRLHIHLHALLQERQAQTVDAGSHYIRVTPQTWSQAQQRILIEADVTQHVPSVESKKAVHDCNYNYNPHNFAARTSCLSVLTSTCTADLGADMCIVALPQHTDIAAEEHGSTGALKKPQALLSTVLYLAGQWCTLQSAMLHPGSIIP